MRMRSRQSLAGRAFLALFLMGGFYVLAIGVAAILIYLPYAEFVYAHRITPKLAIFCIGGAALILWSILPRIDKFTAPGPPLDAVRFPRLFQLVSEIARATDQKMPSDVYLVADMNAWVSERGGIMGFGSRRVMGLGLPLLQVLSVSQLRAVLAHEFGHYYGGDTKLVPWVYKTRVAIARTLGSLSEHSGLLSKPFEWYGAGFIRITHAVSRSQELAADELAARVAGARALADGLKIVHGGGAALEPYLYNEVLPVIESGYRPPVAEGFGRFMASAQTTANVAAFLDEEIKIGQSAWYDTHPPLRERLALLRVSEQAAPAAQDPPAISLLGDTQELEAALLPFVISGSPVGQLKPITWDEVTAAVWIPAWKSRAGARRYELAGVTIGSLSEFARDPAELAVNLKYAAHSRIAGDQQKLEATGTLGAALAVALHAKGWIVSAPPGEPVVAESGQARIRPFDIVHQFASGAITADQWAELCSTSGIADVDLGSAISEIVQPRLK